MALAAVRSVGDAVDLTREYLRGRTIRAYLLLAGLSITLGPPGVGGPPGPVSVREETLGLDVSDAPSTGELVEAVGGETALWGLLAVGIALAVGYVLLGAFAAFAFYRSLVDDAVAVRAPARRHRRGALELFGFRLVAWGLAAGAAGWLAATYFARGFGPEPSLAGLLTAAVVGLLAYLSHRLTTDFVVPIMLAQRCSLVDGWRCLLGVVRDQPAQFAAYVPVRVALEVAGGVGLGAAVGVALLVLVLLVGLPVFAVAYLLADLVAALAVAGAIVLPLGVAVVAAVVVPFHVYFHGYALLTLGDVDPSLDLVGPWRRRLDPASAGRL
ncbi:MAG: hypothetical protein ACLFM8_06015 [Halobacteriales archaeon]